MRVRTIALTAALLLLIAACGGAGDDAEEGDGDAITTTEAAGDETTTTDSGSGATAEILGEDTAFAPGGNGASGLDATIADRECELTEVLFGSCRASTGAGGAFLVTAEGDEDVPGDWNVVVRCGLEPAEPVAAAAGTFQPIFTDLGLAGYGEVIGITLRGTGEAEVALIYQPEGSDCPVIWGLGPTDPDAILLGGTDALNGEDAPIQVTRADGTAACADADGNGGIEVSDATAEGCAA
ncbi:MAG: hypothetical protein M3527_02690 [Actinomycetota bacterium]|nr:hypothetical protein [Acidimicrobiia bacterium]MDQ3293346.1 hypothetical protein [Actinomycetota bacterium]